MLTVTQKDLSKATNLTQSAVSYMLTHVQSQSGGRARRYPLHAVLPLLGDRYRWAAPELVELAKPDDTGLFIGDMHTALATSSDLCAWLEADPKTAERLAILRQLFFSGLAATKGFGVHAVGELERLRKLIASAPDLLPFVVTGDKSGLPDLVSYSRAFVIINLSGVVTPCPV